MALTNLTQNFAAFNHIVNIANLCQKFNKNDAKGNLSFFLSQNLLLNIYNFNVLIRNLFTSPKFSPLYWIY